MTETKEQNPDSTTNNLTTLLIITILGLVLTMLYSFLNPPNLENAPLELHGIVYDLSSGDELSGVKIVLDDKDHSTTTNDDGFYKITLKNDCEKNTFETLSLFAMKEGYTHYIDTHKNFLKKSDSLFLNDINSITNDTRFTLENIDMITSYNKLLKIRCQEKGNSIVQNLFLHPSLNND